MLNFMEKSITQIFGDNVRKKRQERGISQQELANVADLHRTYIGMVERGERNITLINAHKIALSLNTTLKDLLKYDE